MPALPTALNMRAAIPLRPFMPEPLTLIIEQSLRQLIPRTGPVFAASGMGPLAMRVPFAEGLRLLRLHASIFFAARGASVFG